MKHLKKMIGGLSALTLLAMPVTAYAVNPITEETEQTGDALITTEIAPSYIVTIPTDTSVAFLASSTDFGSVELTQAQLDPGKAVSVTVVSDGELNNASAADKIIPYVLTAQYIPSAETEDEFAPFNAKDSDLVFDTAGEAFAMTIEITEDDWNAAATGSYSDTVTFNIAYTDAPEA